MQQHGERVLNKSLNPTLRESDDIPLRHVGAGTRLGIYCT